MTKWASHFALVLALVSCQEEKPEHHRKHAEAPPEPTGVQIDSAKLTPYSALPDVAASKDNPVTDDKVALGKMLFSEERLSRKGDLSCNSCHDLGNYGVDGKDFSTGEKGTPLGRNSPSIYNAALGFAEFWDGSAETVEAATSGILLNPEVMGEPNEKRVVDTLKSMPAYTDAFKKAFPDDADPVTLSNVAKAIGAFSRKLLTPAKWDQFLKSKPDALSDDEKKGFLKFVEVGCPTCHVGPLVGGTMYQKLGKEKPWPNQKDKGRSAFTKSPSDDMMFKVAELRNIEHTGPYFHDASAKTLEEAIKTMANYQLAKELSDDDVRSIATWLKSLTGTPDAALVAKPTLPPSTATTPKPDKK